MKTVIRKSYTPKLGDYCNTLVVDKETGNQYIFDNDGVWTLISTDEEGIIAEAVAQANAYTDDVAEEKVDKEEGKGLSENDFTDALKDKLDGVEDGAQENVIETVKVNGAALTVTDKTVDVTVPTDTSDLTNGAGYVTKDVDDLTHYYTDAQTDSAIAVETGNREGADAALQQQIDAIVAASDVVDIVGTYAELQNYDTTKLHNNDIIKVLSDETRNGATTYYRWSTSTSDFTYIGSEGPYYTRSEADSTFVPQTRTVNNKALSSNITLTAADVGALPDSTIIPTVNDATLTIQKNGVDVTTFTANSATNTTANITVPTKTSDLTNDGADNTSTYVEADELATVATSGSYNDLTDKPTIDFELVEMSYGESNAWAKFIDAYQGHKIVYCRASSNSDPSTGTQGRKAFMAYVNNAENPTEVEFQYVRSVSTKTSSQPVDQVFVYKLTNANGGTWTVQTRDMGPKLAQGTNTTVSYSNGTYTVSATQPTVNDATLTIKKNGSSVGTFTANASSSVDVDITVPTKTSDITNDSGYIDNTVSNLTNYYDQTTVNNMFNALTIPTKTSDLTNDSGFVTDTDYASANDAGVIKVGSGLSIDNSGVLSATGLQSVDWTGITNKPTNVSYWTNDAGYITSAAVPTKTSDLTNDSGFITSASVPTKTSDLTNDSGFITDATNSLANYYKKSETYSQGEVNSLLNAIVIPTKTSDLTNDGSDGTAQYLETDETAYKTASIPYGQCDSTSTSTVFTATVPGVTELRDGVCMWLKNGVVTSASGFTININNLGAKPVYNNMAAATRDTTLWNVNYTMFFVYDSTRVEGGCWILYRGYNSDNNTIGYQLRTNSTSLTTTDRTRYYRVLFTSADNTHWVPANTQYDNSATSNKTINQRKINPFGRIVYLGNSTSYLADATVSATAVWDQYAFNLGYSFSKGSALTMTYPKPVYVKCAPQSDGSAIIDSTTPYVQDLPSTDDGKIYIYLGIAYSATNVEMVINHPIYYYKDGAIREWSNAPAAIASVAWGDITGTLSDQADLNTALGAKANSADLATVATSGSYNDLTNKPTIPVVPTNVSSFTNDAGYITSADIPSNVSAFSNDAGYLTSIPIAGENTLGGIKVGAGLAISSGGVLSATGGGVADSVAWGHITGTMADQTDLTNALAAKANSADLATVATSGSYNDLTNKPTIPTVNNATLTIQKNGSTVKTFTANASSNVTANITVPTKTSDLTNDSGFLTTVAWGDVTGKPTFATVATSGSYNDLSNKPTIPAAQVNSDWDAASGVAQILNKPTLSTVATSGSYNDLSDKPTIPAAQVNSDWNAVSGKAQILNKPTLATVATSGSYNDLTNKPTIPTVNNATLTIQKNGTNVQTFTANQSTNATANITVPTKTSDLTNDSGFLTSVAWSDVTGKPTFATVATSGSYNDLTDTPVIPSGVTLYTSLGENTDGALTQKATRELFYNDSAKSKMKIGVLGFTSDTFGSHSTSIGDSSRGGAIESTALGYSARTTGDYSVAIGSNASIGNRSRASVIGYMSSARAADAVALGSYALATREYEVNIGTAMGGAGYDNTQTRLLGGVHAGLLDTDAVNVGQLNTALSDYATTTDLAAKQNLLSPGNHIDITSDVISATGYVHSENPQAAAAATSTITGSMIANGTITADKLASGATVQLTLSSSDIGEGSPLAANTLYGVYI